MREGSRRFWRSLSLSAAVASAGAIIGILAVPAQAAASTEMTNYTCYQYDVCMPGGSPCCFEIIWIPPGEGRCSTMC
jgi:hypothetical protein